MELLLSVLITADDVTEHAKSFGGEKVYFFSQRGLSIVQQQLRGKLCGFAVCVCVCRNFPREFSPGGEKRRRTVERKIGREIFSCVSVPRVASSEREFLFH